LFRTWNSNSVLSTCRPFGFLFPTGSCSFRQQFRSKVAVFPKRIVELREKGKIYLSATAGMGTIFSNPKDGPESGEGSAKRVLPFRVLNSTQLTDNFTPAAKCIPQRTFEAAIDSLTVSSVAA
jgi:hypothetical protein